MAWMNNSVLALAALTLGSAAQAAPPTATIAQGEISGETDGPISTYLGIPYAAPPTGHDRWRAPRPAAPWAGMRTADHFGPSCSQGIVPGGLGPWTQEYMPSGATSEDCLTLNIWTPASRGAHLPVMVWIHGGGFTSGSSSVSVYDGHNLSERGIVVVSLNYRLGMLGFFGSSELRGKGGGNFGLQDQIAALAWVKQNISAFGGDPKRITIVGQSAGAASVHLLILSPAAKGLFAQAIPQSGIGLGLDAGLNAGPPDEAEANASALLQAAGAPTLEEARQLPLQKLAAALMQAGGTPGRIGGLKFVPYADGELVPLDPKAAFASGRYNDTPVLMGLTSDEGSGLNAAYNISDPVQYRRVLAARYGAFAAEFERLYPAAGDPHPLAGILRDGGIVSVDNWVRERARTTRYPMYGYIWTHTEPGPEAARYGAFHSSEIPYVFSTLDKAPSRHFTALDNEISQSLSSYWVNFVKTGNPNGAGLPDWPAFAPTGALFELGDHIGPSTPVDHAKWNLLERYYREGHSLAVF